MSQTSKTVWRWVIDIIVIIAGSGVYALGVHCFTAPNNIAPGGVTGVATIISYVTDWNIGTLIAAINIPLRRCVAVYHDGLPAEKRPGVYRG